MALLQGERHRSGRLDLHHPHSIASGADVNVADSLLGALDHELIRFIPFVGILERCLELQHPASGNRERRPGQP